MFPDGGLEATVNEDAVVASTSEDAPAAAGSLEDITPAEESESTATAVETAEADYRAVLGGKLCLGNVNNSLVLHLGDASQRVLVFLHTWEFVTTVSVYA